MSSTFLNLIYHIVFSTKHREPLITPTVRGDLYSYIGGIVRAEGGTLIEIGGIEDHVHAVVRLRSTPSLAEAVKVMKAKSSKWVNDRDDQPRRFEWQVGYAAFTVSASQLQRLISYVQRQDEHHRRTSFKEELIALLQKHGVEYDERYIFD